MSRLEIFFHYYSENWRTCFIAGTPRYPFPFFGRSDWIRTQRKRASARAVFLTAERRHFASETENRHRASLTNQSDEKKEMGTKVPISFFWSE